MHQAMAVTVAHKVSARTRAARADVARLDRAQWELAVREFGDYSYRQSWAYGVTLARRRGAISEHVAIRQDEELIGLADVRIKRVPVVGGGLAYISGGPLVRRLDGSGEELERLDLCVDALVREFVERRNLMLRLVAPIGPAEWNQSVAERLERAGLRRGERGEHYRTVLLDIDRPADEIRSSLHRHWRRHLNAAGRADLEISFGTERERFEQVAQMSEALSDRKGFELDLDGRFFADVQTQLDDADQLLVGLVLQDGRPVAGNITAVHGDTGVYLTGASTEAGRDCKAAYLMHWRTIEVLRERGLSWYDLGGIDPVANPGVTSFKLRTNGIDVTAAGPYERLAGGVRGRLGAWAERAYAGARRVGAR
jgi:Acetyltransferase (GNAT) domain